MSLKQKLAEKELERREKEITIIPNVLQECLPYQLEFINDPARRKFVCGTRRAAKSFMMALYLINEALTISKGKFIYMALTNESAKSIMWTDIFEIVFLKYDIDAKLNSKLEIEFGNGSIIYLRGLDATPNQMNRLRGQKFDLACIDECQDFTQDLNQIINGVLKMSLAQSQATLILGGTPGNHLGNHYWWKVNKPDTEETEWKSFKFSWRNNTSVDPKSGLKVCDAIEADCQKDIKRNPLIVNTETWKQEVEGQWVIQTDARVYKSSSINYTNKLPDGFSKDAFYILGVDLGYYPDPTTFVVLAYNKKFNDKCYIIESDKFEKFTVDQIAEKLHEYRRKFNFRSMYADSGAQGKMIVETIRSMYKIPLQDADKRGKEAHVNVLNSDFITQNIFIIKQDNQYLIDELETLIWDPKLLREGKRIEHQGMDNNLTDAMLYAHHGSRHFWYQPPVEQIDSEEAILREIEQQFEPKKTKMRVIKKAFWENEES